MKPRPILLLIIIGLLVAAAFTGENGAPDKPNVITNKQVVLVRESADDTPALNLVYLELRDGKPSEHFKEKEVLFDIVDQDGTNETGQAIIDKSAYAGKKPPLLLFYAKRKGTLNAAVELPANYTAEDVLTICGKHGA